MSIATERPSRASSSGSRASRRATSGSSTADSSGPACPSTPAEKSSVQFGRCRIGAGAAVVMNPWNGAIYALASSPHYDQAAAAHNPGYLARLLAPRNSMVPLLDRATQGLYPTGLALPGEAGGVVPTPAWLRRTFHDPAQRIWYEGYSVNLSIGQGYLAVTPLQLAVAYSALANGGNVVRPHVASAVVSATGRVLRRLRFPPTAHQKLTDASAIRQGLYDAAHAGNGTAAAVFGSFPIAVAGKTGTAQTPHGSDHSWYASWAPAAHPRVVVVVLIEHGGFGVESAAPAARE